MRSHYLQIASIFGLCLAAACGGTESDTPQLEMRIGFSSAALQSDVGVLRFSLHNSPMRDCSNLASRSELDGLYNRQVDVTEANKNGGQESFNSMVEGTYTIVVYGFADETAAAANQTIAYGCSSGVKVELLKLTTVPVIELVPSV